MTSQSKRILVTGGAGYIGTRLVPYLCEKGYRVRVLDRMIFGEEFLAPMSSQIEIVRDDIRTVPATIMEGVDAIIHLAGFSTDPTSQYDPRLTDLVNHLATERLALMTKRAGIKRFIYASTCSVYFSLNTPAEPLLYREVDQINPISAYSFTKRCSEQALLSLMDENFKPVIFRKGTLFGYAPRMRFDLVFNAFVKDAFYKKLLTIDAGGYVWRPMIDIADIVRVYTQALEMPIETVGGHIFNLASHNISIGDLAGQIKNVIEKYKGISISLDIKPPRVTRNYKADATKFQKTFGFTPQRTVEDAVLELWDKLEKGVFSDGENDRYYGDRWYQRFFETEDGKKFKEQGLREI